MSNSEVNNNLTGSQPTKSGINSHSESNRGETHVLVRGYVETTIRWDFCDMKSEMKAHAEKVCDDAFSRNIYNMNNFQGLNLKGEKRYFRDMAQLIKQSFEHEFKGTWHVVVGNFSFDTSEYFLLIL